MTRGLIDFCALGQLACITLVCGACGGVAAGGATESTSPAPPAKALELGTLNVELTAPGALGLSTGPFNYVVVDSAWRLAGSGTVAAPELDQSPTFQLQLPAGEGYQVMAVANPIDDSFASEGCSASVGPFGVKAGETSALRLNWSCADGRPGQLASPDSPNPCAKYAVVGYTSALPFAAAVGNDITLIAPQVQAAGSPIDYTWTRDSMHGEVALGKTETATFTCAELGPRVLIRLSTEVGGCSFPRVLQVFCLNPAE